LCAKEAANGLQTTLQGKEGRLITVMGDWEQLHTNATALLKPAKHYHSLYYLCHSLFRAIQGHEKFDWEKQTWLSMAILLWCLDSARV